MGYTEREQIKMLQDEKQARKQDFQFEYFVQSLHLANPKLYKAGKYSECRNLIEMIKEKFKKEYKIIRKNYDKIVEEGESKESIFEGIT
ncbi:MAG: hypothetical protein CMO01_30520 [Thalassobius sp.]|nr:hypothetical protein [Thalassovita sp.]